MDAEHLRSLASKRGSSDTESASSLPKRPKLDIKDNLDNVHVSNPSAILQSNGDTATTELKPFRLLDLPAEIRLEVYRACLARPFSILLSKEPPKPESDSDSGTACEARRRLEQDALGSLSQMAQSTTARLAHGPRANVSSNEYITRPVYRRRAERRAEQTPRAQISVATQPLQAQTVSHPALARPRRARPRSTRPRPRIPNPIQPQPTSAASQTVPPLGLPLLQPGMTTQTGLPAVLAQYQPAPQRAPQDAIPTYVPTTVRSPTPTAQIDPPNPLRLDPLVINLLRVSKQIYKEARPVLYGENKFELDINTAVYSMAALHQRSRSQIRCIRLTISSYDQIIGMFSDLVRIGLRYCWRLAFFTINMPFLRGGPAPGYASTHTSAFGILRWLPRTTKVILEGNITDDIIAIVQKNATLAEELNEVLSLALTKEFTDLSPMQLEYARRQLIPNDGTITRPRILPDDTVT